MNSLNANAGLAINKPRTTIPKSFFMYKTLHGIYTKYIIKFSKVSALGY
jgi:hypothetical protein